jgi:hypothetical protein
LQKEQEAHPGPHQDRHADHDRIERLEQGDVLLQLVDHNPQLFIPVYLNKDFYDKI